MKRDIENAAKRKYDVAIAGGGIYGACITDKMAQAGYKTILLEASDFGTKTSANNLGILHGGLRYIQHFNFRRLKRSVESRRYFLKLAPQLVQITAFHVGIKKRGLKNPTVMRFALWLNDWLTKNKNSGLATKVHIPNSKVVPSDELDPSFPVLKQRGVVAVARWFEAVLTHPERMVLETVLNAKQNGAAVFNYCRVEKVMVKSDTLKGIQIKDRISGQRLTLRCRWFIDATGRQSDDLYSQKTEYIANKKWARSNNLILNRNVHPEGAIGAPIVDQLKDDKAKGRGDERQLFLVPKGNTTVIGTFYTHQEKAQNNLALNSKDKERYIKLINQAFPFAQIKVHEPMKWHSGWLPLSATSKSNEIQLQDHSQLHPILFKPTHTTTDERVRLNPRRGIIEVRGVKFTTAPAVADDVVDLLQSHFMLSNPPAVTEVRLTSNHIPNTDLAKSLYSKYGIRWTKVNKYLSENASLDKLIDEQISVGEICYAIDHEYAMRLDDILARRACMAYAHPTSSKIGLRIAKIMQAKLAWSDERMRFEVKRSVKAGLISK